MKPLRVLTAVLVCGLALTGCAGLPGGQSTGAGQSTQVTPPPAVKPDPTQVLKDMAAYLRSLDRFKVRVEKTTELILPSEQRLHGDQTFEVALRKPNQLRADVMNLAGGRQVYYNGETFTIYTPAAGFYATGSAPSTIDETLEVLYNEYQIELPVTDLLTADPASRMVQQLQSRTYVGQILVQGVPCHHLAFRTPEVDWEIWIQTGTEPLPRRLVITDKSVKGSPTMMADLSDWSISPRFSPGYFTFKPPAGAERVPFMNELSATLTAGTTE